VPDKTLAALTNIAASDGMAAPARFTPSETTSKARKFQTVRVVAELGVAVIGIALVGVAIGANQRWLDHHILPSFLLPRDLYLQLQLLARIALGAAGAWLIGRVRPCIGRLVERVPDRALPIAVAALLALGASEPALRHMHFRPVGWLSANDEPRRQVDPRLGWTFVPARTGYATVGGRRIEYAVDVNGYRVRSVDRPVDGERPSILFTGESVMFGEGLMWDESIPAHTGALLQVQSANIAVHGYGNDQAYLRLETELPRFRRPVAVVSLFMTTLFGRNLDHERPHLRPGLRWRPPVDRWRIESLARMVVPYRSDALIDEGIRMTREVLAATAALARSHGAAPLVVTPQFGRETEPEQRLRRRVFEGLNVPVALVEIDPAWRLPWDRHPDARAARSIAEAIAARLR
jgi:hypothetical protein